MLKEAESSVGDGEEKERRREKREEEEGRKERRREEEAVKDDKMRIHRKALKGRNWSTTFSTTCVNHRKGRLGVLLRITSYLTSHQMIQPPSMWSTGTP